MHYSFTITALSLLSSAFAITVTTPSSDTVWDFTTPKTIKFTSDSSDPSVISIILRTQDGSFQVKLADNVKTSTGEYTTQPDPSISNGDDYEIQIIDSAGQLAVSDIFTVEKGASDNGTTPSSTSTASTSSTSSTLSSSSSSFITTSTTTTSASGTSTPAVSASTTSTLSTSSSSSTDSKSTSSTTTSSASADASSTTASATAQYNGAVSSQYSAPVGIITLVGAAFAMFYI